MYLFPLPQHALSEKAITQLQNKMDIEQSHVDKTISILDKKIDKEVANLLATFERYRNDVIKYAAGEDFQLYLYIYICTIYGKICFSRHLPIMDTCL